MKETGYSSPARKSFFRRYGVYLALVISLLAVGGVAVAMLGQGMDAPADEPESSAPSPSEMVEQVVTNQPDDRTTTTSATATTTTKEPEAPDLFILPLSNTVQKVYSPEQPLFSETMGDWRVHTGTDFAGESGQTVKALTGGTVVTVEEHPLWGWCITIDHGVGVVSRCCGVKPAVAKGDTVEVGQTIGTLDTIPCESAQPPHLHLEMTIDGRPVDPVTALAKEVRYADSLTQSEE